MQLMRELATVKAAKKVTTKATTTATTTAMSDAVANIVTRTKRVALASVLALGSAWVLAAALSLASLGLLTPAHAQKPAWEVFLPQASEVGAGQFRWWGFLVYDATLWAPSGQYQPGGPFALSMRYARDVSRQDIVQASIDQMRDLGFAVERHPEWTQKLNQVMESVKSGDTLTGVYMPGQGAVFFYNDQLTGQVDERLANAFFAIWLNPKTSQPKLRLALLGEQAAPTQGQAQGQAQEEKQ